MIIEDRAQLEYRAADSIRDRCFINDLSYLFPTARVWTIENIESLVQGMEKTWLDTGKRSFIETLKYQLADLPEECTKLAADALISFYLFPHESAIKRTTKQSQVATVLSWEGLAAPDLLRSTFGEGIGGVGTHYVAAEDQIIKAFLLFALHGKREHIDFASSSQCSAVLASLRQTERIPVEAPHVMLHLLFPEEYEPIASDRHKRAIVSHYAPNIADQPDVDASLRTVRSTLEEGLGKGFGFYAPATRAQWDPAFTAPAPAVVLQPCGNEDAYRHYLASIERRVPVPLVLKGVGEDRGRIAELLGGRQEVAVWGVSGTDRNQSLWKRLKAGDFAIFARSNIVFSSGTILGKVRAPELARELWGGAEWEYAYFLDDIRTQDMPYSEFNKLVGYDKAYRLRDLRSRRFSGKYAERRSPLHALSHAKFSCASAIV